MNMKQEGPFLVPQLWKDSISLENITNDFLESNVTGEVMNLDDFLKELQVNELAQQTEELQRHVQTPNHLSQIPHTSPPNHRMGHMQQDDARFQPLIRPANIETIHHAPRGEATGPAHDAVHFAHGPHGGEPRQSSTSREHAAATWEGPWGPWDTPGISQTTGSSCHHERGEAGAVRARQ